MNYWYSPATGGFYPQKGPHKFKPAGAVSVSESDHAALFPKGEPQREIVPGPKGKPQWREYGITERRAGAMASVKSEARRRIDAILPLPQQLNLIREGAIDDPRFAQVDAIRAASNFIEQDIEASEAPDMVPIADHPLWPEDA